MSSKPSPGGVEITIDMLDTMDRLSREIEQLRPKAVRLKEAEAELGALSRKFSEHLRSMDVEQQGNYGWEGRFGWFLSEMLRQARSGT